MKLCQHEPHRECTVCLSDLHRQCTDPQTRTRSPRRVEMICCCPVHEVIEVKK